MNYKKWPASLAFLALLGCGGGSSDAPVLTPKPLPVLPPSGASRDPQPEQIAFKGADEMAEIFEKHDILKFVLPLVPLATDKSAVACSIDFRHLRYKTVDEHGKPVDADGIMMIPRGASQMCGGPKPMLLYSHGTWPTANYDFTKLFEGKQPANLEAMSLASTFASRGYIVVAPNYGGYGESTMSHHPFLNGDQLGKDSADAFKAANSTLNALNVVTNGNLYLSGISEGGYTTMAANRELQRLGVQVKAVSPISSPAAISLLVDQTAQGNVSNGGTFFMPLLVNSWQHQFGDIFRDPREVYADQYVQAAEGIATPFKANSFEDVAARKIVPEEQLFPGSIDFKLKNPWYQFTGSDALLTAKFSRDFISDVRDNPCDADYFEKADSLFPLEENSIRYRAAGVQLAVSSLLRVLPGPTGEAVVKLVDVISKMKDSSGNVIASDSLIMSALKLAFPAMVDQINPLLASLSDILKYSSRLLISEETLPGFYSSLAPKLNCTPKTAFRKAALKNDLRSWTPPNPMLMCGGSLDPTVPFVSTVATIANLRNQGVSKSTADLLDLEATPLPNSRYERIVAIFKLYETMTFLRDGGVTSKEGIKTFLTKYHAQAVSPICLLASKVYFDSQK
ncbi:prolyl oligopeptidase family serine peptidase [Burkholderia sp. A1]|uniref:alpha/beta hydrolase family protein n=1 Tax=Burkholderia sp. A1 TaxID=148446 RepID=UPI000B1CD819|nr:prolyl oligopeptidase family serine peptidase [Burkholderia sp. A1]